MNTEPGTGNSATADDGDELDPTQAAAILAQATRQAKLEFDPTPPWRLIVMALVALLAYGAIWLSVCGQHPYSGPSAWALLITYALIAGLIAVSASSARRATTGITGPSVRQRRTETAAIVVVYIAVYVFMGALRYLGVSHAIVYGVYPAVGLLIIAGAAGAGLAVAKENWLDLGTALAIAGAGAICAYGGPVGVWLATGISRSESGIARSFINGRSTRLPPATGPDTGCTSILSATKIVVELRPVRRFASEWAAGRCFPVAAGLAAAQDGDGIGACGGPSSTSTYARSSKPPSRRPVRLEQGPVSFGAIERAFARSRADSRRCRLLS